MPFVEPFGRTNYSFAERTGSPDEFSCAIGRVAIWFAALEDEISAGVIEMLGTGEERARILLAEMSFRNKVHAMASLIRHQMKVGRQFNVGNYDPEQALRELIARCLDAEDLRNQVMHSSWEGPFIQDQAATRMKYTAKATHGLRLHSEFVDSGYLLDVADFICYLNNEVRQFFFAVDALAANISEERD